MTDEQPKFITEEQFNSNLNSALKALRKDFEKTTSANQEQLNTVLQALQGLTGNKPVETGPLPNKSEVAEKLVEQDKQIKALLERDRQREEASKKDKLSTALRAQLNKHGILSKADLAEKFLADQVSYDEDGALIMKFEEIEGAPPIALPLHEAISKFAQTDTGKYLADPKELRGSGAGNTNSGFRLPAQPIPATSGTNGPVFKDLKSLKQFATESMPNKPLVR